MADQIVINSFTPVGGGKTLYEVNTNLGDFYYRPSEYITKGLVEGNIQYYRPDYLNPDVLKTVLPVKIDSQFLEGKPILEAGYSNPNEGILFPKAEHQPIVDKNVYYYEITDSRKPIQGIGYVEAQGANSPESGNKYIIGGGTGTQLQFINPDANITTRTVTQEKKGGVFGSLARGIGDFFGNIPILGDVAAFAIGGPALLGVAKGGQAASAGLNPVEAFTSGAISGGLLGAGQALATQAPAPIYTATPVPAADVLAGAATPSAVTSLAPSLLGGAAELASVGQTGSSLTGPITSLGGPAELATVGATMPTVPSAFDTAVSTGLGQTPQIGQFGPAGTAGFGTALAPAAEVAAGLEAAGFAPGTAANLAGLTAAGTGATGLLGGATAIPAAAASTISVQDALRGARLVNSLLTPQQPQTPNMLNRAQEALKTQGGVDYTTLLSLLSQRATTPGLLGTRFQPQSINLASLLG